MISYSGVYRGVNATDRIEALPKALSQLRGEKNIVVEKLDRKKQVMKC